MVEIADLVSTAVLRRHLETMDRLDIEYDFLPRESEILRLHFWDRPSNSSKRRVFCISKPRARTRGAG